MAGSNLELKKQIVDDLKVKLSKATSIIMVEYRGLTVSQDTALRNEFRKNNVEYKVIKNKLVLRALNELGHPGFDKSLEGPTAFAIGYDSVTVPAKIVVEQAKKLNKIAAKAGLLGDRKLDADGVKALAAIPSKEILVAQLLMVLQSPVRKLAQCLDQIAKK